MAVVDELIEEIFAGLDGGPRHEFESWLRGSRRFQQFATAYRSKIRSKLRQAGNAESLQDVRAELEAAALLLSDKRFALEYEAYAALKKRGPDFTVTYRENVRFNVEVRRVRAEIDGTRITRMDADDSLGDGARDADDMRAWKLVGVVAEKVGQMPPSIANLLWLAVESGLGVEEVADAVMTLRLMAERKEADFFLRRGYGGAADFLKRLSRLSGIVLRQGSGQAIWLNTAARHPLAAEVLRAVEGLAMGD